jgi:molybdopterin-binding protein
MQLSARNQFPGRVSDVHLGTVMAEVHIDIGGGHTIVSVITRASAVELALREGDEVVAVIKSTEVLVAK